MYGALIVFSVPMPLIAGWAVGPTRAQAADHRRVPRRRGRVHRVPAAGDSMPWLWVGIVLMGLFSFAE